MENFFKSLQPWLPPLLTVLGWWVVSRQTNRRERRKEIRSIVDAVKKRVVDTAAQSIGCMCGKSRDAAAESEVKAALDELEIEMSRLPFYASRKEMVKAMADFADACTGGDFESVRWVTRLSTSREAQAIILSRNWLLQNLEERLRDF